jgi:hypothetical protein
VIRADVRERFQRIVARADANVIREREAIRNGPKVRGANVPVPRRASRGLAPYASREVGSQGWDDTDDR